MIKPRSMTIHCKLRTSDVAIWMRSVHPCGTTMYVALPQSAWYFSSSCLSYYQECLCEQLRESELDGEVWRSKYSILKADNEGALKALTSRATFAERENVRVHMLVRRCFAPDL